MAEVHMTHGHVAIVDDDDLDLVAAYTWYPQRVRETAGIYAVTARGISMHRLIMGARRGQVVDHINRNTLDNRRENLRLVTAGQNAQNRRKNITITTSQYRGVCRAVRSWGWQANIQVNGRRIALGYFDSEEDAAVAYNQAARHYYKDVPESALNPVADRPVRRRNPRPAPTSQYRGVSWDKQRRGWYAQIQVDGKKHYIGVYASEHDAALAYNRAALDLVGIGARLNAIQEQGNHGNTSVDLVRSASLVGGGAGAGAAHPGGDRA